MATPEQLLDDAINAMAELHNNMEPDENEENAIIKPMDLRKFVDAHARLLYERERMSPKAGVNSASRAAAKSGD
jgi:hypothetical protein